MLVKNVSIRRQMSRDVTNDTGARGPGEIDDFAGKARVGELVRQHQAGLSPAERKLARVLLASYPIAGLESVARFAERAAVSPPTVTRFITKLGFKGYPEFQEMLRQEVQARLSSPLARYQGEATERKAGSLVTDALEISRQNLQATLELLSHRDVEEVVELLADVRRRVLVLGGRLSGPLARYLAGQLHLLRPGVGLVDSERTAAAQQLIDLRKGDVLVVFDYRRYQADTIDSVRLVSATWRERGAVHRPLALPRLGIRTPGGGVQRREHRPVRLAGRCDRRAGGCRRRGAGTAGRPGGVADEEPGAVAVERGARRVTSLAREPLETWQ